MTTESRLIIGCGYLGLRVAKWWLEHGIQVAALTRSEERANEFKSLGIRPIVGDVTQLASLNQLPAADVVLHAVGFDRTAETSKRDVYVGGLQNVLDSIRGRIKRFIHVSSVSVYGQTNGELVDEESPTEPATEGGQVCLDAERCVTSSIGGDGQSCAVILRLAGIYGPGRLLRRVESLQSSEPIAGNPDAWLNLIHINDAVEVVLNAANGNVGTGFWNVSDGKPVSRREYFSTLARIAGAPQPRFDGDGSNRDSHTRGLNKRVSNQKLRDELGGALQWTSLSEGLNLSACQ